MSELGPGPKCGEYIVRVMKYGTQFTYDERIVRCFECVHYAPYGHLEGSCLFYGKSQYPHRFDHDYCSNGVLRERKEETK